MMPFRTIICELVRATTVLAIAVLVLMWATGCQTTRAGSPESPSTDPVHTERNPYAPGTVAWQVEGAWQIANPPTLRFTGETITGAEIKQWARGQGIQAVGIFADTAYAQLEAESAIRLAHWTKALVDDLGLEYRDQSFDCEQYAKISRTIPDLFAADAPPGTQAAVFGIFAHLERSFAGVTDGFHALNVAWTDLGIPVFEPQGRDLIYQDIRAWPSASGITHFQTE